MYMIVNKNFYVLLWRLAFPPSVTQIMGPFRTPNKDGPTLPGGAAGAGTASLRQPFQAFVVYDTVNVAPWFFYRVLPRGWVYGCANIRLFVIA